MPALLYSTWTRSVSGLQVKSPYNNTTTIAHSTLQTIIMQMLYALIQYLVNMIKQQNVTALK